MAFFAFAADPVCFASWDFSGYAKNLYQNSRSVTDDRPYWQDLTRLRLSGDASHSILQAHLDYDHEFSYGTFFRTADYALLQSLPETDFLDMEKKLDGGERWEWRHKVYRGWVGAEKEGRLLRIGRQRIAWGAGKIWNPTDVLNPYQPLSLEREERRGVDSLYLRRGWRELGQLELVYAAQDRWRDAHLLGRAKNHFKTMDYSFMGGHAAGEKDGWMAGGDLAMDLKGGQLHGELTYSDPQNRTPFWKVLIGYEYGFTDSWLNLEYYRNGRGSRDKSRYDFLPVLLGREVQVARDYLGLGWTWDFHALWKLEFYSIVNLNDSSYFLGPGLSFNALKNLHLSFNAQIFGGSEGQGLFDPPSELGRLHDIYYLTAQYYF